MRIRKVSRAKVTFKVIQKHWQWCQSIGHIRFRISVPLCSRDIIGAPKIRIGHVTLTVPILRVIDFIHMLELNIA